MTKRMRRTITAPLVLLAVVVGACERADAPEALLAPQFSSVEGLRAVEGDDGAGYAGAVTVDASGATLSYAGHKLAIPAGAVSGPTVFEFTLVDRYLGLEMTATSVGSSTKNDVGSAGFAQDLVLTLSFDKASRQVNGSTATVALMLEDGRLEPLAADVDMSSKTIRARLKHFSGYIVAD